MTRSLEIYSERDRCWCTATLRCLVAGTEPDRTQLSAPQCPTLAPSGAMIDKIPHRVAHEKPGGRNWFIDTSLAMCTRELPGDPSLCTLVMSPSAMEGSRSSTPNTPCGLPSGCLRHDSKHPSCMVTGWVENFILEPVAEEIRRPPLSRPIPFVFTVNIVCGIYIFHIGLNRNILNIETYTLFVFLTLMKSIFYTCDIVSALSFCGYFVVFGWKMLL